MRPFWWQLAHRRDEDGASRLRKLPVQDLLRQEPVVCLTECVAGTFTE